MTKKNNQEQRSEKTKEVEITKDELVILSKREKIFCYSLAVFSLIAPWIFTRYGPFPVLTFSDTGEIGDTIGGISAPFIGLVAAFLVYKSFEAQIKANHSQQVNHREQLNFQQENHDKQMRLIRKEQGLSTLSYLFKEIEPIIYENEAKLERGSIGYMIANLEALEMARKNIGVQNYEEFVSKKEVLIAKEIEKSIYIISYNINHLKVVINHVINYSEEFFGESNTVELTNFYTSKINSIINRCDYRKLLKEPVNNLEGLLRFDDPNDVAVFISSRNDFKEILDKFVGLSFSSLF
ncbi:hypothetical protein K1F50_14535 [Muricauda oceani]|uniref:Phage abortive infection protein n=1 Tax=Flagellimonas oceani TaxID=2698672 RepID=A0A6G7J316_9FLAO|nr:hypothetical protein [Allomuricauda oceani]MBW8244022.1 hypothetical protein [Allomuricauda oceani]QII44999.1 hypothetical protein GVT53_09995 [Allomuricauda oceani]